MINLLAGYEVTSLSLAASPASGLVLRNPLPGTKTLMTLKTHCLNCLRV